VVRRGSALVVIVLAVTAAAGCELIAGIKDRPLAASGAVDGATDLAGGAGGTAGSGGTAAGTGGAGTGGAALTGGATGTGGSADAAVAADAAGMGGASGAPGTGGTTGSGGATGSPDAGGKTDVAAGGGTGGTPDAAGSGGAAGAPYVCPPVAANQPGIVDFETVGTVGAPITNLPFRTQSGVDGSIFAMAQTAAGSSLQLVNDGHGSAVALNFSLTGSGLSKRAGTLYIHIATPPGGMPAGAQSPCVDASRYAGIRFWAKGPASGSFNLFSPQPTGEMGVVSHSSSTPISLAPQWQLVEIPWNQLVPATGSRFFSPSAFWLFTFAVEANSDISLTLDDIAFIEP
jgi:hypothetical protein